MKQSYKAVHLLFFVFQSRPSGLNYPYPFMIYDSFHSGQPLRIVDGDKSPNLGPSESLVGIRVSCSTMAGVYMINVGLFMRFSAH